MKATAKLEELQCLREPYGHYRMGAGHGTGVNWR
jgi:hypothetical protein